VGPPPLLFLSSFFARQAAKVAKFGAKPTGNKEPGTAAQRLQQRTKNFKNPCCDPRRGFLFSA